MSFNLWSLLQKIRAESLRVSWFTENKHRKNSVATLMFVYSLFIEPTQTILLLYFSSVSNLRRWRGHLLCLWLKLDKTEFYFCLFSCCQIPLFASNKTKWMDCTQRCPVGDLPCWTLTSDWLMTWEHWALIGQSTWYLG